MVCSLPDWNNVLNTVRSRAPDLLLQAQSKRWKGDSIQKGSTVITRRKEGTQYLMKKTIENQESGELRVLKVQSTTKNYRYSHYIKKDREIAIRQALLECIR